MMFSVVIPLYNKVNQVAGAIKSVLAQSNDDFELIIVDDGSSDGSYDVAIAFTGPRVHVICETNGGVSVARNTGIHHASGDYVCFLDADDLWLPEHLASLKVLIEAYPGVGLYATRSRLVEHDGSEKIVPLEESTYVNDLFELELATGYSYLHTNSVCIPIGVFNKVGYFVPGEKNGEDSSLWLRIAAYYDVVLSKAVTTVYRREYSDAFIGLALPANWSFLKVCNDVLLSDEEIPKRKRDNIAKYVNRYLLSLCRHEILIGNRDKSREYYSRVNWKWAGRRKKIITDICFLVPSSVLREIYHRKYHDSFRNR